jgi:transposase
MLRLYPFKSAAANLQQSQILVWDTSGLVLIWKQLQQSSFRWPPIMDGVVKLSAVEFAALFDGIDWTRVQTIKGILKPTVAA